MIKLRFIFICYFDIFLLLDVILLPCDAVLSVTDDDVVVGILGPKVEVTFGDVLPVVGGFRSWAEAKSMVVVTVIANVRTAARMAMVIVITVVNTCSFLCM